MTAPRYVLYLTSGLAHAFDAEQRRSVQLANQEAARRILLHDQLIVLLGAAERLLHAAVVNSGARRRPSPAGRGKHSRHTPTKSPRHGPTSNPPSSE